MQRRAFFKNLVAASAMGRIPRRAGFLTGEPDRLGTEDWQLSNPAIAGEIEGFAASASVSRGERINFFVNTAARRYTFEVFRTGWYQGLGARRVHGPLKLFGQRQPEAIRDESVGLVECQWTVSHSLEIPSDPESWPSGIYLVRLTADSGKQAFMIFVLRDDQRLADIIIQHSITTDQAYNNWGGRSLYDSNSANGTPAYKVSFNRPFGPAYPHLESSVGAGYYLNHYEYNFIRWLEKERFNVKYVSALDVHQHPELITSAKIFISNGHDEYWSAPMRDGVERARDLGVNLAIFSSNTAYWQIRMEPSEGGAPIGPWSAIKTRISIRSGTKPRKLPCGGCHQLVGPRRIYWGSCTTGSFRRTMTWSYAMARTGFLIKQI